MFSNYSKKKLGLILIIFTLFLIPQAKALTKYEAEIKNQTLYLNSTIELTSEEEVNFWKLSWRLPENSTLLSIKDSLGEIENYEIYGNTLKLKTNQGERRKREVVKIKLKSKSIDKTFKPLLSIDLSLSGFKNGTTYFEFEEAGIISWYTSFKFQTSKNNSLLKVLGKGPLNVKVFFSEKGRKSEHFVNFEDLNLTKADKLYRIVLGVTGIQPDFDRFPVVVLPDKRYEKLGDPWSSGTYRKGGLILLRNSTMKTKRNLSVLIHETTHGFNAKALRWTDLEINWFDEGVAKFLEYLVNKKLGVEQAEIFGEKTYFREKGKKYYLKPRGKLEDLLSYYRSGKSIKNWDPEEGTRKFGYAFSELIIRKYIMERGYSSLRRGYEELLKLKQKVNTSQNANEIIVETFGLELTPCNFEETIETCLKKVNSWKPRIPIKQEKGQIEEIQPPEINLPKVKPSQIEETERNRTLNRIYLKNWKITIEKFLNIIKNKIIKLLRL